MLSPHRRSEIIDALRRGTVPRSGLDVLAVGIERFAPALDEELGVVAAGRGGFKAVRGEYGSGKTFFGRWLQERARSRGFATSEVQVSETETPLHRMETVYRRLTERLATQDASEGALRNVVDGWFYTLEEDVLAEGGVDPNDAESLVARTDELLETRLAAVTRQAPAFSAVLRAYRRALVQEDQGQADGLLGWLGGQPNVAASVKRAAGIKGEIDHFGATNFLAGLLTILRDSGYAGLLLVIDEVETLQRMRADTREKGLNALRQLVDEIDAGRFPGLFVVTTGTPAFFDGPQGVQRLPPLAQRLHVDFATDARFDNPRAVQVRLPGFDLDLLARLGTKVRDIYADGTADEERMRRIADDGYVADLARAVTGQLGGRVGIAPRLFLKKLVADVLDRIDQFGDFDPRRHYALTVAPAEMTAAERAGAAASSVDEVELDL
ncbi:BREX system ATP-binding protein BrxD [Azospirillum brasilense]|uniref:BREX system ATP-binding protein BrxD n=1 Tax=Azospirillum brasilense TaxID=192 RepID=UPI000E67D68F|nr:BREX system ATP-binding protein BrxD [Azospirillum brasilense]NUB25313.1 BREX system ATP-binding protein BrxD [Azospirillum brasilense]NUB33631.1 BREX system ATP-binding protein BrxD [Azospirillum brasilense]RIW01513.1 BREX system ATP-binding protein BrxD [Azospirillum brasilense]